MTSLIRTRRIPWILLLTVLLATLMSSPTPGQVTRRASLGHTGDEADGLSACPVICGNGRYVVFQSAARNLVPGDTNGSFDVFVRDLLRQETERVSVASDGTQGNAASGAAGSELPYISREGRFVVFTSSASNLVAGDTNSHNDVFVRDRLLGITEIISVSSAGVPADDESDNGTISEDGRYVAFESHATNLVIPDTNGQLDVFVRDRQTGTTVMASVNVKGNQGSLWSQRPSISADGRYVAFSSFSTNLVWGDTNLWDDVFVRDLVLGTNELVSVASDGTQGDHSSGMCRISADGRFVSFSSSSSNLVADDTNGGDDAFVHDRLTGETVRVTVNSQGDEANRGLFYTHPSMSDDGQKVAFVSRATNLVPDDTNNTYDAFLHDRETGTTRRVSVDSSGNEVEDGAFLWSSACLSSDGRQVTFWSESSDLVEDDRNAWDDVFLHGPAFTLQVDPVAASPGALLDLSTWRGNARAPCALFVTGMDGVPFNLLITVARLDLNGEWLLTLRVPNDPTLCNHSVDLTVFSVQPVHGGWATTNEVTVSIL